MYCEAHSKLSNVAVRGLLEISAIDVARRKATGVLAKVQGMQEACHIAD